MPVFKKVLEQKRNHDFIVIVSGLPRSGTSMMMRMLEAGGMKVVTDNVRKPNQDNPKGYYEFEKVKKINDDITWLDGCRGKAVKMVSELLYSLPPDKKYKVIFMRRSMVEILASQKAMLERLGRKGADMTGEELSDIFEKHLEKIDKWLLAQGNIDVLYVNYNEVVANPRKNVNELNRFFKNKLKVDQMCQVVDSSLYRQRKTSKEAI